MQPYKELLPTIAYNNEHYEYDRQRRIVRKLIGNKVVNDVLLGTQREEVSDELKQKVLDHTKKTKWFELWDTVFTLEDGLYIKTQIIVADIEVLGNKKVYTLKGIDTIKEADEIAFELDGPDGLKNKVKIKELV